MTTLLIAAGAVFLLIGALAIAWWRGWDHGYDQAWRDIREAARKQELVVVPPHSGRSAASGGLPRIDDRREA